VATFQASDPGFLQYRSFLYLRCRLLSALQYDLGKLEEELDTLDAWEASKNDPEQRLVSRENDLQYNSKDMFPRGFQLRMKRTRPEVLADLKIKMAEYGEANVAHWCFAIANNGSLD
jgi:hypothetical protein